MNRIYRSLAVVLVATPLVGVASFVPSSALLPGNVAFAKDSLYKRLGGYDASLLVPLEKDIVEKP